MADKKAADQYYSPPPKLGKWEGFCTFLWNSETGQFLGRTGSSWGEYQKSRWVLRPFTIALGIGFERVVTKEEQQFDSSAVLAGYDFR